MPYVKSFFVNSDIELTPEIFSYIQGAVMIVAPIFWTIYVLKRDKTKRYSYLFVRDQWDSFLAFRIENFASIVLILYPVLLIIGSFFVKDSGGEYGVYAFLYKKTVTTCIDLSGALAWRLSGLCLWFRGLRAL